MPRKGSKIDWGRKNKAHDEVRQKTIRRNFRKIYKAYVAKQLDETNEQITKNLIDQLSELLTSLEMVEEKEELKDDLRDNET